MRKKRVTTKKAHAACVGLGGEPEWSRVSLLGQTSGGDRMRAIPCKRLLHKHLRHAVTPGRCTIRCSCRRDLESRRGNCHCCRSMAVFTGCDTASNSSTPLARSTIEIPMIRPNASRPAPPRIACSREASQSEIIVPHRSQPVQTLLKRHGLWH